MYTLFDEFCRFLQFSQTQTNNNNFLPQSNQFLQLPGNSTQQNIFNQFSQTPSINIPPITTTFAQQPQQFPQLQIDPKRMSYISSAIEKRKAFFNGKQGSDPHRFLYYLTECQTSMGITDTEIYNCLPVVLNVEALDWFKLNKVKFPTFTQFSKALVSNFSVKNYQDKLMYEALARQQGKTEPITTFVTNIRLIFNQMEPKLPESRQIDITCNNLNPNYIQYIRRSHVKTFEDLIEEGKDIENNLDKIRNYKGPPNPNTTLLKSASWPKKSSERTQQSKKPPEKEEIAATKATNNPDSKKQKKKKSLDDKESSTSKPEVQDLVDMPNAGECFKCRQEGHLFKECPNESKYKIFCYRCGKLGKVTVVKCPNCKDRQKKND